MGDSTSEGRRWSFRPGKKTAIAFSIVMGLGLMGLAGISYATYDYSSDYEGRILPGAEIAGVDVSGMTKRQAISAVRAAMDDEMSHPIDITWRDHSWTASKADLGARLDVRAAVQAALAASEEASFMQRARMRVFGDELDFSHPVAIRFPMRGIRGFVAGISSDFSTEPRDASIDYSSGWIKFKDEREGRQVLVKKSARALSAALEVGEEAAELEVATVAPEITSDAYKKVLLVHIGENKLYLYEKGKITNEWTVATGMPEYMTPTGEFSIELKRYMPTWVNPHPDDDWGKSMPLSIPPGPNNPLGLRALNWTAPNIRFHGTPATYSLGYNASHGCVRMANEDVIELYDMIDVGHPDHLGLVRRSPPPRFGGCFPRAIGRELCRLGSRNFVSRARKKSWQGACTAADDYLSCRCVPQG